MSKAGTLEILDTLDYLYPESKWQAEENPMYIGLVFQLRDSYLGDIDIRVPWQVMEVSTPEEILKEVVRATHTGHKVVDIRMGDRYFAVQGGHF